MTRGGIIATIVSAVIMCAGAIVGPVIAALISKDDPVIEDETSLSSAELMTEDMKYSSSAKPITEDTEYSLSAEPMIENIIVTTESNNNHLNNQKTLKHANGEIIFGNSKCGTAYIYKDYINNRKVGTFYDKAEIKGWYVKIYLDNEFFMFFVKPSKNILEGEYYCYARNGKVINSSEEYSAKIYKDIIYAALDENGNLRIIYNIVDEPPFDLSAATKLKCSIII